MLNDFLYKMIPHFKTKTKLKLVEAQRHSIVTKAKMTIECLWVEVEGDCVQFSALHVGTVLPAQSPPLATFPLSTTDSR